MSAFTTMIFTLFGSITYGQTRDDYYLNWMGKMSENSGSTAFDFQIQDFRLIDIIIPGSHHSGMYASAISANNYLTSTDTYYTEVFSYYNATNERFSNWAQRQVGTIEDQLNAGSRFIDIRLESKSGTIYAHNGLLGATLSNMLIDIKNYLTNSDDTEIIILSFNDFLNVNADSVFTTVQNELITFMEMTSSYNIQSDSIATLLTKGVKVIPFYDGTTTNQYVHDSTSSILTGSESKNSTTSDVISSVISQLVDGWDTSTTNGEMNQIYYTLNINTPSKFTSASQKYSNYLQFNGELALSLSKTIENYPKLYFGNIVIMDFIQASDVIDQVITLNYNYGVCRDPVANWGDTNNCPILTDLARDYKVSGISSSCTGSGTSLTTTCRRSCGSCSWRSGVPGSQCDASTPCDSPIYIAATGGVGTCFETPPESESLITGSSFCLSPFSNGDCGTIASDQCNNNGGDIISNCNEFCSADFQCLDGYCNTGMGVCLLITTPAPTTAIKSRECYCPRIISEKAVDFRDDIEGFRPGDANGKYEFVGGICSNPTECNDTLEENPYIKSIVGFILIPFAFAIVMFISYCCCCLCWCSCGTWSKKRCCRCCLGDPRESIAARWVPSIIMAATLIVILWASIEGVIANAAMHDHVFDANNPSLRREILGMFDIVIDKFEGVGPDADYIVDNVKDILGSVDSIIDKVDGNIGDPIDRIYDALNYIAINYDNFSIPTNITQPFGGNITTIRVPCDYCTGLKSQINDINSTFSSAVGIVNDMKSLLNSSSDLVGAQDQIDEYVAKFNHIIDNFTNQIESYQTDTNEYLNDFETYDKDRESGGFVFFIVPIIWIILWIIGISLAIANKAAKAGEWCFKCTWCLAMWIGATIMLIFSFFAIISVGWADFCVNLDEFEADPLQSRLGQSITSFGSGNNNNSDENGQFDNIVEIVNACWTGADLLDIFNLSDLLDWDQYRNNLTDILNIDITKELSIDTLDSFTSEINLLNTDEFEVTGDEYLASLNAVGGDCVCQCGSIHGSSNSEFTRSRLRADQCYNNSGNGKPLDCWFNNPLTGTGTQCVANFTQAYIYVNGEEQLQSETQSAIDDIKTQTGIIISAYDEIFGIAVGIEDSIQNISCSIDPIFEKFDALITNYSNCGFLGAIYGGFKEVGCVLLFTDMYWISTSMMIIAFLSILIVCLGFMTQYSWHPVNDESEEEIQHDFGQKMVRQASRKFVSTDFGRQVSQRVSALSQKHLPGLSQNMDDELEMAQEMDEGGGGGQNEKQQQAPPPNEAPPGNMEENDGGLTVATKQDEVAQNNNNNDQQQPSAPTDFHPDTNQHGDVL